MDIKEAQLSVTQSIGGNNYGNMNIANGNIDAINIVNQEQKEELINLIKFLKLSVMEQNLPRDDKDSVLDDLDTIEEQVESKSPKAIKLKKCIDGIKMFISKLPNTLATGSLIITKAEELYSKIKPLIEN
ncbi:MAG: hypothetical protein ACRCWM_01915 [Sarcina sp.]